MVITPGSRIGPYEVLAPIGAGGMGEVFRARDTKLHRDVALKVLPAGFAADRGRLARFRREAQLLAALNHPNVAAIYALEEADGTVALALELVDGEDLAQRLHRGAIPVEEALAIARQIAEGLEAAHERGVVHRDLKPANVKLTEDGTVKVLDFGLAKAFDDEGPSELCLTESPTLSRPMTEAGVILGTAPYMSPEQARGRPVDKRSDIWSFGVVLHEMLTGRRLFRGETVSDVLAAVLRQEVRLDELPPELPPSIRRLLARCLDRDPRRRLRDIGEARVALESPASEQGPSRPVARERLAWSLAALALLAAAALGYRLIGRPAAAPARPVRLAFEAPPGAAFDACPTDFVAVSPDGRTLLFTGRSPDGKRLLWTRALDSGEARPLAGTDDALEPFWSPDSRSIAFGTRGKLRRLDLTGGQPRTLCDAPRLVGGTWGLGDLIFFVPDFNTGVFRVSAEGGEPARVTRPDVERRETAHRSPSVLPGGRHVLYTGGSVVERQVFVASVDGGVARPVVRGTDACYAAGYLLFVRDRTLMAQPFDARTLSVSGDAVPIGGAELTGDLSFSASENGVLVIKRGLAPELQLVWHDREGRRLGAVGPVVKAAMTLSPRLSPDGTRVALQNRENDDDKRGIWLIDLARDIPVRLSSVPSQFPQWSPDGKRVAWVEVRDGIPGMREAAASGAGQETFLLRGGEGTAGSVFPLDYSPDGRFLLYYTRSPKTRVDIWALPVGPSARMMGGPSEPPRPSDSERRPHPVLASEFDEREAQVSPDGRFVVYSSDVSGAYELYAQSFTPDGRAGGERWRLTQGGGRQPRFRRDGKELFYLTDDGRLVAVDIRAGGEGFEHGPARELFRPRILPPGAAAIFEYDVTRDGQRFLVGTLLDGPSATPPSPIVMLGFPEEISRRLTSAR